MAFSGSDISQSISMSVDITKGSRWHVLGYLLLINIITLIVSQITFNLAVDVLLGGYGAICRYTFNLSTGSWTEVCEADPIMLFLTFFIYGFVLYALEGIDYIARPILFMDLKARQAQRAALYAMYQRQAITTQPSYQPGHQVSQMMQASSQTTAPTTGVPPPTQQQVSSTAQSTQQLVCPSCGKPNPNDARFCISCGRDLTGLSPS